MRRPDRFSYFLRVNPEDPGIEFVMSDARASPGCRAIRLNGWSPREEAAAAEGQRMQYFRMAEKYSLPVFVFTTGRVAIYEQYIRACPSLPIIFDHCGFPVKPGDFEDVLRLAAYPNVHLKWSHAPLLFSAKRFPFPEVRPFLARALDAFGRERVMWCSDCTAVPYAASLREGPVYTWGEALFYMRDNPDLSEDDKAWVLGRSARKVLDWSA
jgi:predicted TIM-barrel fold metal-dependent hydrolase